MAADPSSLPHSRSVMFMGETRLDFGLCVCVCLCGRGCLPSSFFANKQPLSGGKRLPEETPTQTHTCARTVFLIGVLTGRRSPPMFVFMTLVPSL